MVNGRSCNPLKVTSIPTVMHELVNLRVPLEIFDGRAARAVTWGVDSTSGASNNYYAMPTS